MAKRGRSKSNYVKKTKKSKKKAKTVSVSASHNIWNALVPKAQVKMVYGEAYRFQTAVSAFQDQLFRGNSVFDPDYTGVGHQPLGHDQWQGLYGKYRVRASKIEIWYIPMLTAVPNQIVCYPSIDNAGPTSNTDTFESPLAKIAYMTGMTGQGVGYMSNYATSEQMFGDKELAKDQDAAAAFGSNPSKVWYWHVYGISPGITNIDFRCTVRITYYVDLFQPVQLTQS